MAVRTDAVVEPVAPRKVCSMHAESVCMRRGLFIYYLNVISLSGTDVHFVFIGRSEENGFDSTPGERGERGRRGRGRGQRMREGTHQLT